MLIYSLSPMCLWQELLASATRAAAAAAAAAAADGGPVGPAGGGGGGGRGGGADAFWEHQLSLRASQVEELERKLEEAVEEARRKLAEEQASLSQVGKRERERGNMHTCINTYTLTYRVSQHSLSLIHKHILTLSRSYTHQNACRRL
jgi:hypothetical protein